MHRLAADLYINICIYNIGAEASGGAADADGGAEEGEGRPRLGAQGHAQPTRCKHIATSLVQKYEY